jgi:hypothetical protein
MKLLLKNVVLLLIGLLAAQPVLSSLNCVAGLVPACVQVCPMAMGSMAPNCPMQGMTGSTGEQQNCCAHNSLEAMLPQSVIAHAKVAVHIPSAELVVAPIVATPAGPVVVSFSARASAPPRYILNQTFRI